MEKWKIAVIVGLLAALPVYGYFQSKPVESPGSSASATPASPAESKEPASPPPSYLQAWWGKKPPAFSYAKGLWANTEKPLQWEDFRGKVLLLELWRAECSHCQEAAPILEQLAERHRTAGFEIVGVHSSAAKGTIEYDWSAVKARMKELGIKYPVAFDEKRTLFDKFKAKKFPTLIILDRNGVIRYAHEGMTPPLKTELEAAIRQILAGKNPTWPPSEAEVAGGAEDAAARYAPDSKP